MIYVVEKYFEFKDLVSVRDKSIKYLYIFNVCKILIEICLVFIEDMDRELLIKFGKGIIVLSFTIMRVARIICIGSVEGNFYGVICVYMNILFVLLCVFYLV